MSWTLIGKQKIAETWRLRQLVRKHKHSSKGEQMNRCCCCFRCPREKIAGRSEGGRGSSFAVQENKIEGKASARRRGKRSTGRVSLGDCRDGHRRAPPYIRAPDTRREKETTLPSSRLARCASVSFRTKSAKRTSSFLCLQRASTRENRENLVSVLRAWFVACLTSLRGCSGNFREPSPSGTPRTEKRDSTNPFACACAVAGAGAGAAFAVEGHRHYHSPS